MPESLGVCRRPALTHPSHRSRSDIGLGGGARALCGLSVGGLLSDSAWIRGQTSEVVCHHSDMSFSVEERGRPNTQEYRVFFSKRPLSFNCLASGSFSLWLMWIHFQTTENSEGEYISPFHDIPIYANEAEVSVRCCYGYRWFILN